MLDHFDRQKVNQYSNGWSISVPHDVEICYISPTMKNVGEMVKLLQLSLWNQRLIK
ncbi:hypothetical protein [Nostoc sp.]|uniref:hypothetical protein n=1 Tax=Nostoc sp. TaxID=1180 RepID=UPI002FF4D534